MFVLISRLPCSLVLCQQFQWKCCCQALWCRRGGLFQIFSSRFSAPITNPHHIPPVSCHHVSSSCYFHPTSYHHISSTEFLPRTCYLPLSSTELLTEACYLKEEETQINHCQGCKEKERSLPEVEWEHSRRYNICL